jgi:PAS domain-containing protein
LARVHPDDLDRVATILGDAARDERITEEWRSIRPDGRVRWVSGRISPITDEDGVIRRIAALFEDITAHKNTEISLRESEKRFDQLARSTEVGFFLRTMGTPIEVLYMNPAVARIVGP